MPVNKNVDVKRKKQITKQIIECGKDDKYIYWVKKRLVWVFQNREKRDDDDETGLTEGGRIEMSTTVLPFTITIITIYYSAHNKHLKLKK